MSISEFQIAGDVAGLVRDYLAERNCTDHKLIAQLAQFNARRPMRNAQWWDILETTQKLYPDSPVGLELGMRLGLHHLGALGYVLANAATAAEAWNLFERFQPTLFNGGFGELQLDAGQLRLEWASNFGEVETPLSDHVLMAGCLHVVRQLTQRSEIAPSRIEWMGEAPHQLSAFESFFRCPMEFGCPSPRIWLPPAFIQLPLYPPEPMQMAHMLEGATEPVLSAKDELLRKLHRVLLAQMQLGHPHIDAVASGLGMSRRSLQRFLRAYDVSYSNMVDAARKRMACIYLQDGQVSLSEVALLLGFSEQSAFNRAFRRWLGISPTQYLRRRQTESHSEETG